MVKDNFSIFLNYYFAILTDNMDGKLTQEQTKEEIKKNVRSFKTKYTYIAELIGIDKVYKKVKAVK